MRVVRKRVPFTFIRFARVYAVYDALYRTWKLLVNVATAEVVQVHRGSSVSLYLSGNQQSYSSLQLHLRYNWTAQAAALVVTH